MQAKIKSISLENFKGVKQATYNFEGKNASVIGANATGKTTIADSLWWLLFNKDSAGNEKFSIRPLDKDGNQIDNVEICVSAVIDIDGKEMELKKVQKQKWVKQRSSSVTTLQGNVNSYEVDGYPKSEKEYKECVAGIVGEDLFKILTSPTYFPNMKWQEQREILMRFVTDISDVELAGQDKRFADLISELEKAPSTDDIKKKYQKALNEWKKKQAEIPIRIDERYKDKQENLEKLNGLTEEDIQKQKEQTENQIAENKAKQEDISKEFEEQQKASDGILELKFELNDLQRKANEDLEKQRREITRKSDDLITKKNDLVYSINDMKKDWSMLSDRLKTKQENLEKAKEEYAKAISVEFDENSLVCQYCGQEFPADKQEQIKANFEANKAKDIEAIKVRGNGLNEEVKQIKSKMSDLENLIKEKQEKYFSVEKELKELMTEEEKFPQSIDISNRPEVQEIQRQISEKEAAMNKGNSAEEIRQKLKAEAEELQKQMDAVKEQFVLLKKNDETDDRIAELKKEQREVAQKVADQEKMLFLLEEFIRYKMDSVSEIINSKLDGICVKLFERQINQGIKECCELTYNGVPYQSLNSGHRIVAGLKIIKALQELYNVYPCVFVDNAESVNAFNLPNMDCQMIFLTVTEDKELRVEIKE